MTTAELRRIAAEILPPVGASVAIAMVDHEPGGTLSNGYPSGVGGRTTFRAGFLVNGRQRIAIGPAFEDGRVARRLVRILNGAPAPRPAPVIPAVLPPSGATEETDEPDQERTGAPLSIAGSRLCAGCGQPLPPGARPNRRTHNAACRQAASRTEKGSERVAAEGAASNANLRARALGVPGVLAVGDVLALWEREPVCVRCGKGRGLDHVLPMASGGANVVANLQNLCVSCNSLKAVAERRALARLAAFDANGDADSGPLAVTVSRGSEGLSPGEVLARHVNDVIAASNPAARPTHPDPDPRVALGDSSVRPALLGAPDPTPMTLGLAER